ncbi:MAG: phosphopantothenoylcysteine decarboxylase [Planctomycetota bacterium]
MQRKNSKIRIVITAGPTREAIDDVRYISNRSSGKMGYAVAAEACEAGCDVTLITGPVSLPIPNTGRARFRVISVESACDMADAAIPAFRNADIAFHVAAVADFRPAKRVRGKLKKKQALKDGNNRVTLELIANPDILWSCGQIKREGQILVGFALEASNGERNAREKLRQKNLDFIVWNDPSALNNDRANVTVLGREGERIPIRDTKSRIAKRIVSLALERWRHLQQQQIPKQLQTPRPRRSRSKR